MKPFLKQRLAAAVLLAASASGAFAQETTSAIRGKLYNPDGNPMASAQVTIIDTRTGVEKNYSTNKSGAFFAPNLSVGGPYKVIIGEDAIIVNSIQLGDVYNLTYGDAQSSIEEVVVTADAGGLASVTAGPAASFGLFELANTVSIARDIKDTIAIDPRINLDTNGAVNCAGKHPRFNSTTLDGVSQNDRFGLNDNGYATATGMPFPIDAIEQVSVELAPYDVNYGGFSACTVNAVSKAGTNEFHGGVFYQYTDDSLRGDSAEFATGLSHNEDPDSYDEFRRGFDLGGPIIKDKLFFYVAYEESEEPEFIAQGYAGSGNGVEREWLSQEDFNRISNIANNIYGYDPGGQPGNGVQEEEKYSARLDWNISQNHDLALIYNYYDGFENRASDSDSDEFEFANHFYTKGAESETITTKWSAQWTDTFSTEVFYSQNEVNDSQVTVGDPLFADMQISIGGRTGTVYLGADDSRQANALDTESEYFKFNAQYLAGDHVITAGYEREALEVFNQFVQHARGGEYDYFDDSDSNPDFCAALTAQGRLDSPDCGTSGIDKFELGLPSRIYYGSGGGTNNPADAAASFENVLNTAYIQDEWYIGAANLTLTAGLRYEWFTSDDAPNYNVAFENFYGVRNDESIDGLDILMPRFGFTWDVADNTSLRGGVGLFSGGNPNVWISNAWSNDGLTNVQLRDSFDDSVFDLPLTGGGRPGFDVPQSLVDTVAAVTPEDGTISNVVIIDPDYEQPGEWKISLGATHNFESGWVADIDLLYSRLENAAFYQDISQSIVGRTTTGAPIYDYTSPDSEDVYMLTNSDRTAEGFVASVNLSRSFENGLTVQMGYAQTRSEDISPMTSSTAGSNFGNTALIDINNPRAGTSNYEVPHRFSLNLIYEKEFIEGLKTTIALQGERKQGQGQSYVMGSSDLEGDGFFGRHLLYVPTGPNDPNVVFGPDFDQDAFFAWVGKNGLNSGYTSRNGTNARWSTLFNLSLKQEVPTFVKGTKGEVFLNIYNLGNLLNDEWGNQYDAQFFSVEVVDSSVNDQGQFVFNDFDERSITDEQEVESLWEAYIGFNLRF